MKVIKVIFRLFLVVMTVVLLVVWAVLLVPIALVDQVVELFLYYVLYGKFVEERYTPLNLWFECGDAYVRWLEKIG